MAESQDLIAQATQLGKAIAQHETVKAFMTARQNVQADTEAQQLLAEYTQHAELMQRLQTTQQPIEPADKQKLVDCEQKMSRNAALKDMMRSQADYVGLMNEINRAMEAQLQAGG